MTNPLPNTFTVDVEDYFQVTGFADRIRATEWDHFESRVVENTHRMLRLLHTNHTRATFFILGWVADKFPQLVRDIRDDGHELACHGYWHRLIYNLTPEEFRQDLRQSKAAIAKAAGIEVRAFRAPSFSITKATPWALDVLMEEGYEIDSSIFPTRHDRYGIPDANPAPHRIENDNSKTLWEVPPSVAKLGKLNLPAAGGGYFRLFPERVSATLQRHVVSRGRRPLVFYIHPWEIDPDQPRLQGRWSSRFRHYHNLHRTVGRLERMLKSLPFGTIGDLAKQAEEQFIRQGLGTESNTGDLAIDRSPMVVDAEWHSSNELLPSENQPHPIPGQLTRPTG
ncbi:XrtA system polysaccharide deacetylase [Thalassoroseus pseudoceratinae]|uniref:XrtA system polysaccharide deacetylase n=1 Tax=Thalassoroseus pseudoceratinae TaxID=2713176 RepID=UPI00197F9599|nr:XrtA system polysaccharide deacetylase [Thalassoroseus pseudoceratinae]